MTHFIDMELRGEKTPKSLLTLNPPLLAKDPAMILHTTSPLKPVPARGRDQQFHRLRAGVLAVPQHKELWLP